MQWESEWWEKTSSCESQLPIILRYNHCNMCKYVSLTISPRIRFTYKHYVVPTTSERTHNTLHCALVTSQRRRAAHDRWRGAWKATRSRGAAVGLNVRQLTSGRPDLGEVYRSDRHQLRQHSASALHRSPHRAHPPTARRPYTT